MYKNRIQIALIFILLFYSIVVSASPRLKVVVVVDGMTEENLSMLRPYWSAGGLRMMSEEAFQTTATFPHQVYGGQETMATLMTGSTPDHHSIMSNDYFNRSERSTQAILQDHDVSGIGTHRTLSARSLLSTTLTACSDFTFTTA